MRRSAQARQLACSLGDLSNGESEQITPRWAAEKGPAEQSLTNVVA